VVIDSSALLAIVFGEPDSRIYANAIFSAFEAHENVWLPASVLVEASIAAESRKGQHGQRLVILLDRMQPEIASLTAPIAHLTLATFRKFGKGVHKASLNLGDCMSYATAEYLKEPLLYKGNDFKLTPVRSALREGN
jgi:ribonuclease VapC